MMKIWRLKREAEKRFHGGHPWVYSSDLLESPKGIAPGEAIELKDAGGENALAWGYGNPHSLIAFRVVGRGSAPKPEDLKVFLGKRVKDALHWRKSHGYGSASFRLIYGEADGLPGLIVDRYLTDQNAQVLVVQPQSAGADTWVEELSILLPEILGPSVVVLRRDSSVRKLENIPIEEPRVIVGAPEFDLKKTWIRVQAPFEASVGAWFLSDLLGGQKTGFFLDQTSHAHRASQILFTKERKHLRVLDLFAHTGQWGVLVGAAAKERGIKTEIVAVDSSAQALGLLEENLKRNGLIGRTIKSDLFESFGGAENEKFDFVACDPPALITSKKNIPQGIKAYRKIFAHAWECLGKEGAMLASSCSYHMDRALFRETLARAIGNDVHKSLDWGSGASLDHPAVLNFPEGEYLKHAWVERN